MIDQVIEKQELKTARSFLLEGRKTTELLLSLEIEQL